VTEPTLETDTPGWTIWISSTRRWWAVDEAMLTAGQIADGCLPLLCADDPAALTAKIQKQVRLRQIHPAVGLAARQTPGSQLEDDSGPSTVTVAFCLLEDLGGG
jgi:hypothetical protein